MMATIAAALPLPDGGSSSPGTPIPRTGSDVLRFGLSRPTLIVKTESNVRKENIRKPDPPCVVCSGSGRVDCRQCQGRGRINHVNLVMLPKGEWPRWQKPKRPLTMQLTQRLIVLMSLSLMDAYALPEERRRKWKCSSPGVLPSLILPDPELRECLTHLRHPPGCMPSICQSSENGKVLLSHGVKALNNRCIERIFTAKPFRPGFSQKVQEFYASVHGNSPASSPTF